MKLSPEEKKKHKNFLPGEITRDGFLGNDPRHIHDIIREDLQILEQEEITPEQIADRLQYFTDKGKEALGNTLALDTYSVRVDWARGMIPCPFGEPGLHHKITVYLTNTTLNACITFSQLSIHMIRHHGFFAGRGSVYRQEPVDLAGFLGMR
ncbi:MAG: hypothetical protein R6V04_13075 [bacterium]